MKTEDNFAADTAQICCNNMLLASKLEMEKKKNRVRSDNLKNWN